jgi:2-C-methyl-D-erythritol 4-phosphate cytidylyltransferase
MNVALIVSGGAGRRFDTSLPKQYQLLDGKRVITFVIDSTKKSKLVDAIVVGAHKEYESMIRTEYDVKWAEAGLERNQTIRNGLEYIKKNYPCQNIIILDAVRPFVKSDIIDYYLKSLEEYQAVATARKITDSLGCYDLHYVDRERYYLLSSPEAFKFDLLYTYMDGNSKTTEIIQQLPKTTNVFLYFEYFNNMKITYKQDLRLAEIILHETI